MKVTKEQLLKIMPTAGDRIDKYITYINGYADAFHIDTDIRMAHYLAQVAHESGELKYTKEIGNENYCHKYEVGKLAKMLGNTHKGDGYKYKGRGLIQITGRANYSAFQHSQYCTENVVDNPKLLEEPKLAVISSMWFFWSHGCNILADEDNLVKVTQKINGGTNGLDKRREYTKRAKLALNVKTCKK